jgi:hypothetical protein
MMMISDSKESVQRELKNDDAYQNDAENVPMGLTVCSLSASVACLPISDDRAPLLLTHSLVQAPLLNLEE